MKKVLIILQFGSPHEWTQQFIDHVQHLKKYGWYFQIYTPNEFKSKGNVEIVSMDINKFNSLVEKKLGVTNPNIFITNSGIPSMHMTDYLVFLGKIFEDHLRQVDYWGTVGLDCVIGRLDHFLPDRELEKYDVWTDDIGQFNANFGLWINDNGINTLYEKIPDWQSLVVQDPCLGCLGRGAHHLHITDEVYMSKILENEVSAGLVYGHPKYHLIHSHDRLENHNPDVKLQIREDGSLWELLSDIGGKPGTRHPYMGREIAYWHFSTTKQWPKINTLE